MLMWLGSWLFCVCSFCPLSGLLMSTIINSGGGLVWPFRFNTEAGVFGEAVIRLEAIRVEKWAFVVVLPYIR